jgi:hypothetical protein
LLVIALLGHGVAHAEPTEPERTLATQLFQEGRDLMTRGRYTEACPKLAESQRLDPGGGTLLNLALCHEKEGRLATAWSEFAEALALATRDRRTDRMEAAEAHARDLEKRLPRVVVDVPPSSRIDGLEIRCDGAVLRPPAWGTAAPVDPGEHAIEATAPGRVPLRTVVRVDREGETRHVILPLLPLAPVSVGPAAPTDKPSPRTSSPPPSPSPSRAPSAAAVMLLVVGGVGVGVGTYFGLDALAKRRDVENGCPDPTRCTSELKERNDRALRSADLATGAFLFGAVALGVGSYLWISSPADRSPATALSLAPSPGGASLGLRRSFP